MPLELSDKFRHDISSSQTSIYPLVIIDSKDVSTEETLYISTVKEVLDISPEFAQTVPENLRNFNDYGLKIPSIKESIDLRNKKFITGKVEISINNVEYQKGVHLYTGVTMFSPIHGNLSDIIHKYINTEVSIYYKSPSCKKISECLKVYVGVLDDVTFTEEKIRITLEDYTSIKIEKDIPKANIGFSNNLFSEKYKNKYIPICYGKVDKAPAVLYKENDEDNRIHVIPDNIFGLNLDEKTVELHSYQSANAIPEVNIMNLLYSPLYVYKGGYQNVLHELTEMEDYGFPSDGNIQFTHLDRSVFFEKLYALDYPKNPPSNNMLQCVKVVFPNEAKVISPSIGSIEDTEGNIVVVIDSTVQSLVSSLDKPESRNSFILDEKHWQNTSANFPNNEYSLNEDIEGWVDIANIKPFSLDQMDLGVFAPWIGYISLLNPILEQGDVPALYYVNAWINCNVHRLQEFLGMEYIQTPHPIHIKAAVEQKAIELGWNNSPSEAILQGGQVHGYQPQMKASEDLYTEYISWHNANAPNTTTGDGEGINAISNSPFEYPLQENHDMQHLIWNVEPSTLQNLTYPTPVYSFKCVNEAWNSSSAINIHVGQYSALCLQGVTNWEETNHFINIFYEEENPDIPYLFEIDEVPRLRPDQLQYATRHNSSYSDNLDSYCLDISYGGKWNGVAPRVGASAEETPLTEGASYWYRYIGVDSWLNNYYHGVYGFTTSALMSDYGWMAYFPNGAPQGAIFEDPIEASSDVIYWTGDEPVNLTINPHTMIPCTTWAVSAFYTGGSGTSANYVHFAFPAGYDFQTGIEIGDVEGTAIALDSGINGTDMGQNLMLSFSMSELEGIDYVNTITYAFGKISCLFNPDETPIENTPAASNYFNVIVSAVDIPKDEVTQLPTGEMDFSLDSEFSTNLFSADEVSEGLQGGSGTVLNVQGTEGLNEVVWSTFISDHDESNQDGEGNYLGNNIVIKNGGWDFSKYRINAWDYPDKFGALNVSYNLSNSGSDFEKSVKFRTSINSIGIVQFTLFENVFDSNFYIDTFGRTNSDGDLIEAASDIVYDIIGRELDAPTLLDNSNLVEATQNSYNLAFSLKEKINSKDLIEGISLSTRLFPTFKSNGSFSFSFIQPEYNSSDALTVQSKDVISFKMKPTPTRDIYTLVNVKYKKDYETGEYRQETGYCDGYDFFGNGDGFASTTITNHLGETYEHALVEGLTDGYKYNYYGLLRADNVLEFESDYIRSKGDALLLRNFLYLQNCNRHNEIEMKLPLKYLNVEIGDVIKFDKLVNKLKYADEDYTSSGVIRNGQKIYPYFIVTNTIKTTNNISVKCTQLHKLVSDKIISQGSLSRMSHEDSGTLNFFDLAILNEYLKGSYNYPTTTQKKVADVSGNAGIINYADLLGLEAVVVPFAIGDINQDFTLNVSDMVMIVQYLLGDIDFTEWQQMMANMIADGEVNVQDVVALVELILLGEG